MSYIQALASVPLPGNVSLKTFMQTVLVGLSNLEGKFVRPSWQAEPPKQPDGSVNWIGFQINNPKKDFDAFVGATDDGSPNFKRHYTFEVAIQVYGPDCEDIASLIQDNLQIPQNLEAMRAASIGLVSSTDAMHVPDLVNEKWVDRYTLSIFLKREVERSYKVQSILTAEGAIKSDPDSLNWQTQQGEN